MKMSQQKTVLAVIAVALAVVIIAAIVAWKNQNSQNLLPDPLLATKTRILALAALSDPLTLAQKQFMYQYLSGPEALKYEFDQIEKAKIIRALNAGEADTTSSGVTAGKEKR